MRRRRDTRRPNRYGDQKEDSDHIKLLIVAGVAVLLLAAVGVWFWITSPSEPQPVDREDGLVKYTDGTVEVNVTNSSASHIEMESEYKLEYQDDRVWYEFTVVGMYLGRSFLDTAGNRQKRLAVTPSLDPDDGVPQAYIVPLFPPGEDRLKAELYVDAEFRERFTPVNVAWGRFYDNFRTFRFDDEVMDGVYRDTVYDENIARFKQGIGQPANVGVGNFTQEQIQNRARTGYVGVFLQ